jgi:CheY-like chemotaxis protein
VRLLQRLVSWLRDMGRILRSTIVHSGSSLAVDAECVERGYAVMFADPVRPAVQTLSVLLVNDTVGLRRLKRHYLERAGYAVAEVLDGQAALAYMRGSSAPLIVVMNTRIPLLDAASILRTVADGSSLQRHAFILTTALSGLLPNELVPLVQDMQVPILGKPFTEQELLRAVANSEQQIQSALDHSSYDEHDDSA